MQKVRYFNLSWRPQNLWLFSPKPRSQFSLSHRQHLRQDGFRRLYDRCGYEQYVLHIRQWERSNL